MKGMVAGVRVERWCQRWVSESGEREVGLVIGEEPLDMRAAVFCGLV